MTARTYSYGTTPEETIRERLPRMYPMELNGSDVVGLLAALLTASELDDDGNVREWASGFRAGILTTLGIEEV